MRAARDVAADVGRVVRLEPRRPGDVAGQHEVAEARREALDLGLDALGHVDGRAVGHVAVGPQRVLPGRGAAAGRPGSAARRARTGRSGGCPAPIGRLARRHLVGRAAQRARSRLGGRPRCVHGTGPDERVVDLEGAGTVAELAEAGAVALGQPIAGEVGDLARARGRAGRPVTAAAAPARSIDSPVRISPPSSVRWRGQRIGDGLGAALRPPASPRRGPSSQEHQPERGGEQVVEREEGVRRAAGEQGLGLVGREPGPAGPRRRDRARAARTGSGPAGGGAPARASR